MSKSEEFDQFMQKVEEVGSIIGGLASKNPREIKKATRKADIYLHDNKTFDESKVKVTLNKTIINKTAFETSNNCMDSETMSKEAFMKYAEKDAKQRTSERQAHKEAAECLKKKANAAFKDGDYEHALDLYNKAILEVKDSCLLYTNRAVTCMRLGLNKRTLENCVWALKLNENSLKAWLLKGRAHQHLGEMEQAAICFREAEHRNPQCCAYIQEYNKQFKED